MKLIDADAIHYVMGSPDIDDLDYVRRYEIDRMPTIDAVPVLRCKDCKYFYTYSINGEHDCNFNEWYKAEPHPDDYCSKGERK